MTDGVARELEQAEARLADVVQEVYRTDVTRQLLSQQKVIPGNANLADALHDVIDAAIEVGRLRALAVLDEAISEEHETWHATIFQKGRAPLAPPINECRNLVCRAYAALAAREEAHGG